MGPVPLDLGQRVVAGSDVLAVGLWLALAGAGYLTGLVVAIGVALYAAFVTARGR